MDNNAEIISSEDSNSPTNLERKGVEKYMNNYGELLESGDQADVVLCVQGVELKAHKIILGAQSPVFHAMFYGEFKEKYEGCVEIEGFRHEVISAMLRYIYTTKVTETSRFTAELMGAADKYQLLVLKAVCEKKCLRIMNDENVASLFRVAHLYDAKTLKNAAMKHINENYTEVIETDGWKEFEKDNEKQPCLELFHFIKRSPQKKRSRASTLNEF